MRELHWEQRSSELQVISQQGRERVNIARAEVLDELEGQACDCSFRACRLHVSKDETVPLDDLATFDSDVVVEHRARIDKAMELPALATRIHGRWQVAE